MKEITGINHVGLRVRDLEVSRAFYEKFGFEFLGGPMGPEPVAIVEHPSGVNINFILNASTDASPDGCAPKTHRIYPYRTGDNRCG